MLKKRKYKKGLVSIIVINYNGYRFLKGCLYSICTQTYKHIEVIFVDNASKDDSVKFVKNNYSSTHIISNKSNFGYAKGSNIGVENCKGEYVMILNNDTVLNPDTVRVLLDAFKSIPDLGVVQPQIRLMNNPQKLDACGSFWTDTGFNYHYGIYKDASNPKYNIPFPVYSVKGVCMLIPHELVDKIGLFDENFWCYFEETDFCHRVWLAGYQCWYYPKTYIYHHLGGTSLKEANAIVQYHSFKNRLCSYLKNLSAKEMIKIMPVYLVFNFVQALYNLFLLKPDWFIIISRSIIWNMRNIRYTINKRRKIQKIIRSKSDEEIFALTKKNPRLSYYLHLFDGLQYYGD